MKLGKKIKRIAAISIVAASMFATFSTSAFAAANSGDTVWTRSPASNSSFQLIQNLQNNNAYHHVYRSKNDSSKVFFRCGSSALSSSYVYVQVLGINNSATPSNYNINQTANVTYNPSTGKIAGKARCNVNGKYSISSLVYERGYNYCTLAVKSTKNADTLSGWWSPDSTTTQSTPIYS